MGTSNSAVIEAACPRESLPTGKRQRRSPELKRQVVEETLVPGASVARVARTRGVNDNQLFIWRRLCWQGRPRAGNRTTPGLLAVRVGEPPGALCRGGFTPPDRWRGKPATTERGARVHQQSRCSAGL